MSKSHTCRIGDVAFTMLSTGDAHGAWMEQRADLATAMRNVGCEQYDTVAETMRVMYGVSQRGPEAAALKRQGKKLTAKQQAALTLYNRVNQQLNRAKVDAFGKRAARKSSTPAAKVSKEAASLIAALAALGVTVKVVKVKVVK